MNVKEMENPMDKLVEVLSNYEQAKQMLCVEVVGADQNSDKLNSVPHTDMENLAMTYRIQLGHDENGITSVVVNNQMLTGWGVTAEQLHADAMENAPQIRPLVIRNLSEILGMPDELSDAGTAPRMYVVTNENTMKGAAAAFYSEVMENAAKEIGGSFFILPSSVHEVLFLPDDGQMKTIELKAMVEEINATQVAPEEKLSDSVYHFDAESRTFELGEKFEHRMAARDQEKADRASVLRDLQDKRSNMDMKPKPAPNRTNAEPVL